jgi:hypothetical protein
MEHTTISSASASAAPPWPASRSPRRNTRPAPEASGGHHGIGDGSSSSRRGEPAPTGMPAAGRWSATRLLHSTSEPEGAHRTEKLGYLLAAVVVAGSAVPPAFLAPLEGVCIRCVGARGRRPEQITNQIGDPHMPGMGGNKRNQQGKGSRALTCRRAARAKTRAPASGGAWREAEGMGREGEDASEGGRGCDGLCGDVDAARRVVPIPSEDANLGRGMCEAGEGRRDCGRKRGRG